MIECWYNISTAVQPAHNTRISAKLKDSTNILTNSAFSKMIIESFLAIFLGTLLGNCKATATAMISQSEDSYNRTSPGISVYKAINVATLLLIQH